MPKQSAGVLLFKRVKRRLLVLLVHPGGPYWAHKDEGVWSIPKGEIELSEDTLTAAKREFYEETGIRINGTFIELKSVRMPGGKIIHAFALEGDLNAENIHSNNFSIEWPPSSGKIQQFPEIDRGEWMDIRIAEVKLNRWQLPFLKELESRFTTI